MLFVPMADLPSWADGEEPINGITHIPGIIIASLSLGLFRGQAKMRKDKTRQMANYVFAGSILFMYVVSVVYHVWPMESTTIKKALRYCDHVSIYGVIAGSYTPFALLGLRGKFGWTVFSLIWAIALFGTVFKIMRFDDFEKYSLYYFVAMGWVSVFMIRKLIKNVSWKCLLWLGIGGLFYTTGTMFYVKLWEYAHVIWHFFVMGGTFSHLYAVYNCL